MRAQASTHPVSIKTIMGNAAFRQGFNDKRVGRTPRFDDDWGLHDWEYERGRLFACLAPVALPLRINGRINPKAIALYKAAERRGYIL